MSTFHAVPRKPIGSPSSEEPAPTEAQTSLLSHEGSKDGVRKGQSLNAEKQALRGVPGHNNGFHQSPGNTDKRRQYLRPIATWWQEALAVVLLLASLVASFATLYPYQGKPIPEWPYSITIGALLSIYSVILRLAATFLLSQGIAQSKWHWFSGGPRPLYDMVLHDNASRGPMGAFGLLYRLVLPVTWQWLGCMLAIAALLVGPFTQQVLQYDNCAVLDVGSEAYITRASAFMQSNEGSHLTLREQSFIIAGLYSPGVVINSCGSGNCTFAPYTTVGYCSRCEDISSQVRTDKVLEQDEDGFGIQTITTSIPSDQENWPVQVRYTSREREISQPYVDRTLATAVVRNDSYVVLIGLAENPWNRNNGDTPAECADPANGKLWRCQGYGAASCSLFPCLRTYHSTVTNGLLHEELVELESEALKSSLSPWFDRATYVQAVLNLSCINDDDRAILRNRSYDLDNEIAWLPYNLTSGERFTETDEPLSIPFNPDITDPMERGLIDRGCLFAVPSDYQERLMWYFHLFHTRSLNVTEVPDASGYRVNGQMKGSQIQQFVWNDGDFSMERTESLFDNITLSLTNALRTNPGPLWRATHVREGGYKPEATAENDTNYIDVTSLYLPAVGQAWTTKTCARIRWPWLILPAIVTIFALVFYVGVSISARTLPQDVRTWKTSPLPFMFYGPGGTDQSRQQEWFNATSQHVDDMDAAARKIHLKLDRDEAGMAFSRKRGAVVDAERSSLTSGSDAVL
ncbi:hypothetical protein CKM354_001133900 [Cercospora kikuchii]|uniref:Uncharacterized protein n=1 Tax=Cercospora kikuchii TaxID=84275 RepID=A0A9P3FI79_9PEZI|nr:uncharacterized protein CKM354_001133900 [Cercospora kikuchii]GIZ48271.1 hypothetical protein CKM354_001133900 [Cercospora kikuchii]